LLSNVWVLCSLCSLLQQKVFHFFSVIQTFPIHIQNISHCKKIESGLLEATLFSRITRILESTPFFKEIKHLKKNLYEFSTVLEYASSLGIHNIGL